MPHLLPLIIIFTTTHGHFYHHSRQHTNNTRQVSGSRARLRFEAGQIITRKHKDTKLMRRRRRKWVCGPLLLRNGATSRNIFPTVDEKVAEYILCI